VIGGSYPGALSAWFKSKYPTHAIGSWSSSGVIHPLLNFYQNDMDVYLTTEQSYDGCVKNIRAIIDHVTEEFKTPEGTTRVCENFAIDESTLDKRDFDYFLADIWTAYVQYGNRVPMCEQFDDASESIDTLMAMA